MRRGQKLLLAGALGVGLWTYVRQRQRLIFYGNLLRTYVSYHQRYLTDPQVHRDLSYHPQVTPRLDLYRPAGSGPYPVLIFIHGGSWTSYPKPWFAPLGILLKARGVLTVIPDYTLYPHATFRQMAQEVAAAIAWTLEHVAEYGGDLQRVFLAGHSAGGHLAGLVTCDPRWLAGLEHSPAELRAFIGLSGVYDVEAEYRFVAHNRAARVLMQGVFEGEKHFVYASPAQYVRPNLPPVLLIHGDKDDVVPYAISEAFHAALQAVGANSTLIRYSGKGHVDYLFDAIYNVEAPLWRDLMEMIAPAAGEERNADHPAQTP